MEEQVKETAPQQTEAAQNASSGVKIWVRALCVLFLLSAASGIYIILSGGACPSKEKAAEGGRPALAALAGAAKNNSEEGVAVVRIRGTITEDMGGGWNAPASASAIAKRIKTLGERDRVKAIILDINSPGGTVGATQEIYNEILRVRKEKNKPVIAMFKDVGASGAYYIAAAADKIIAQPGTMTGSIGVLLQGSNFEGLAEKVGVKFFAITSASHKDMMSPWRAMTQEERTLLQNMVDDTYAQFFDAVKESRTKINPIELKVYADGRVFTGRQAFSVGLIDALGGETEALALAGELAGLENPKLISVRTNDPLRDFFLSFETAMESKSVKNQIETAMTPTVAYLWRM